MSTQFIGMLVAISVSAAFSAVPATADDGVNDTVLTFFRKIQADDRAGAAAMVQGKVKQDSGFGPLVTGGPHEGRWNKRIVTAKSQIAVSEAFQTFSNCAFNGAGKASPDPKDQSGWARYSCPEAVRIYFYFRPSSAPDKVEMYDLGRALITLPPSGQRQ